MNQIKKIFMKKDFALFLVIGGVNTLNGTVLSFVYSMFLQENIAFVVGYLSSLTIAYFLNSFFVFHAKPHIKKYAKFAVSYIPNFMIQTVLVFIFYNGLHWHKLLVYALAAAIGLPVTFLLLKLFAFKSKSKTKD